MKSIEKYPELFNIGLHGPDILFYYRPLSENKVNQTGFGMHERRGKEFFENAAKTVKVENLNAAFIAYLYGFICHFSLDTTCHGYIDEKIEKSGVATQKLRLNLIVHL